MKRFVIIIIAIITSYSCLSNNTELENDHKEVVLRKIGHEILLASNDSFSLVKPIIKEGNKYRIQFGSNFSFEPDNLVKTIDSVIKTSLPDESYLVQVEECETNQVVYSYEIGASSLLKVKNESSKSKKIDSSSYYSIIPCGTRIQPRACYDIVIQFIDDTEQHYSYSWLVILLVVLIVVIGLLLYKKKKNTMSNGKITIGNYLFDEKSMTLIHKKEIIELTSKESELLSLLYKSVNHTIDRDTILNKVWGDEGDYVGRTLDVFISKLRKKLEQDPSIQLKNIRGVGYKLIIKS